ncbi:serine protease, partial [Mortierella alpina]
GVNIDHKDFGGRAEHGPVFLPGTEETADVNGHGTFVAALAAGSTYGVAKKAQIVSLKTLDNAGAGRLSNVLAAIEWVVNRHLSQGKDARSIINLSLGAEHNEPTNQAIQEAMRLGIHFSIAAGNDGKDACQFSPASTPGALTVGATDGDDTIASYSNSGPCVAIYAPGSNIVSAWAGSNSATHTQSGTFNGSGLGK